MLSSRRDTGIGTGNVQGIGNRQNRHFGMYIYIYIYILSFHYKFRLAGRRHFFLKKNDAALLKNK